MSEPKLPETYLGDGVYAVFDGYHITLDLRAQPPTMPITKIGLEPHVFERLIQFRLECLRKVGVDGGGS